MGIESDQEIVQLVGTDPNSIATISASFEECVQHNVYNTRKALECIFALLWATLCLIFIIYWKQNQSSK